MAAIQGRFRSLRLGGLALLGATVQAGCYAYTAPLSGPPSPGSRYAFEITDQGRVGLADRLGSGVETIQGSLVESNGQGYLISVIGVTSIAGGTSHWSGERVTVPPEYVARVRERRLSKGRTALATGGALAAIGAFVLTRTISGSGGERTPPTTPPCCDQ